MNFRLCALAWFMAVMLMGPFAASAWAQKPAAAKPAKPEKPPAAEKAEKKPDPKLAAADESEVEDPALAAILATKPTSAIRW